ncbi:MAG TPA: acyl-CoA dehydrogenase family protein [Candidatus Entotheonella sp.]|jgi:alkylation response protein AidB-like acyl-CoA dehydrogenase
MDFSYTPEEEAFRQELRAWLEPNLQEHRTQWGRDEDEFTQHPSSAASMAWHKRMYEGGWIGLNWPVEYGGRGATQMEQVIFTEECMRLSAPPEVNGMGINMVGPMLMHYGTEAQKQRYLNAILSADEIWCQGFSEPGSGSDLASLSTRAVEDGDDFVVTGAKIWTSNAHHAQWCLLLVRTDPEAPKHKGISCLLVDMQSLGISIRPLLQMTRDAEFNQVYFEHVRVPKTQLLGTLNEGWRVAVSTLSHERGGIRQFMRLHRTVHMVEDLARERGKTSDPIVRQRLAQLHIDKEILRLTTLRALTKQLRGEPPGPEGSIQKLSFSRTYMQAAQLADSLLGPYQQLWKGSLHAVEEGHWAFQSLFSRRYGIAGGTDEVQKNIIAERQLILPK